MQRSFVCTSKAVVFAYAKCETEAKSGLPLSGQVSNEICVDRKLVILQILPEEVFFRQKSNLEVR